ncbi:collagen alpha-1(XII) chain-like [Brachionus plicatilis]|uniref:Collagen alpha-1(XII) chain-like n=1 Tax=Brachionus plicatilis TaxID=10195 RepID=A0A3M7QUV4_BRAPC|nr:collagen alpha-1(XII) chain-like [Brachionus plicatilis]
MNKILIIQIILIYLKNVYSQSSTSRPLECLSKYGNPLEGKCMLVDNCTGAALDGNCGSGLICCIPDKAPLNIAENGFITKALFFKIVGKTLRTEALYGYFVQSLQEADADSKIYKAAAFLSQLIGESNFFKNLESRVIDSDFNINLGNNATGDGTFYQGRGAILLRGKSNYFLANATNLRVDIVKNPEKVAFPSIAFRIAAWFWRQNAFVITTNAPAKKNDLGMLADGTYHNFTLLTYSLTNNLQKLKDRTELYESIIKNAGYGSIKRGFGVVCEIGSNTGYSVPICLVGENKPYCGCEGEYEMRSCPYGYISDNRCRGSSILKCCVEKCTSSFDMVVLMDSSGSIGSPNFKKEKEFVLALLDKIKIGENDTRVSIINYNANIYNVVTFNSTQTKEYITNSVNNIPYNGGGTYTFDALKRANDVILQEKNGMRSTKTGIPKVVIVITDGASQNRNRTLFEAQQIKERGFNVLSVGVGNIDRIELIGIASTPADQYFVDDFDKIKLILSGLTRTTCQQPATVELENDITSKIEKNAYKYFKYSIDQALNNTNASLDSFSIELSIFDGDANLFYSFEEENPKSDEEFLTIDDVEPDTNFIEKKKKIKRMVIKETDENVRKTKLYQIDRPLTGKNDLLYFSVKGYQDSNEFKVFVHSKFTGHMYVTIDGPLMTEVN